MTHGNTLATLANQIKITVCDIRLCRITLINDVIHAVTIVARLHVPSPGPSFLCDEKVTFLFVASNCVCLISQNVITQTMYEPTSFKMLASIICCIVAHVLIN